MPCLVMVQKQRQGNIETEMRVAEKTNKAFVLDHPTAVVWHFWKTLHPYILSNWKPEVQIEKFKFNSDFLHALPCNDTKKRTRWRWDWNASSRENQPSQQQWCNLFGEHAHHHILSNCKQEVQIEKFKFDSDFWPCSWMEAIHAQYTVRNINTKTT